MRARFVRVWRDRSAGGFRVIKQGIKVTGMAAWGQTHDDEKVWIICSHSCVSCRT
jgi:hypothetical protein